MIRGTTPTHSFNLPVDAAIIKELRVIYAQNGEPVQTKTKDQFTFAGGRAFVLSVTLMLFQIRLSRTAPDTSTSLTTS